MNRCKICGEDLGSDAQALRLGFCSGGCARVCVEKWERPRRAPAQTFEVLSARVRGHAAWLKLRGFDELAQDLLDEIDGDPHDADQDVYGRTLVDDEKKE